MRSKQPNDGAVWDKKSTTAHEGSDMGTHRHVRRKTARCLMGWHDLKPVVRPWRPGPLPPGCRGLIRVRPTLRACFHMGNVCRKCGERRGQ